jgi:protein tyrosine/serine phosphatase
MITDHGLLRLAYLNLHRVGPDAWRSAQPSPSDLQRLARRHGIRTVLCIRGGRSLPLLDLERETCARLGIEMIEIRLRGREAPKRETVLDVMTLLDRVDRPILIHCKSGADRSGFVAALYQLTTLAAPAAVAAGQLHIRFGHLAGSRAGILDAFFAAYQAEGEAKGLGFRQWLTTVYDAERLTQSFKPRTLTTFLADRILRREY